MPTRLTKTQQAVLDAIEALTADGRELTFVDLTERLGMSDRAQISTHLVSLRTKGCIVFGRKLSSIRIIDRSVDPQSRPSDLLREMIEEAAEALAAEIGHAATTDALVRVFAKHRAKAKEEKFRDNNHARAWRKAG